jgi:hypothetical protein
MRLWRKGKLYLCQVSKAEHPVVQPAAWPLSWLQRVNFNNSEIAGDQNHSLAFSNTK